MTMNPSLLLVRAQQIRTTSFECGKLYYHCCFLKRESLAGIVIVLASFSARKNHTLIHAAHPVRITIDNLHRLPFNFLWTSSNKNWTSFTCLALAPSFHGLLSRQNNYVHKPRGVTRTLYGNIECFCTYIQTLRL
jgi:hypothetical protein